MSATPQKRGVSPDTETALGESRTIVALDCIIAPISAGDRVALVTPDLDREEIERLAEADAGPRGDGARCRLAINGLTIVARSGRGRPKAWHRNLSDLLSKAQGQSDRTRQNEALALHAQAALTFDWEPCFAWLWKQAPQPTIEATLEASSSGNTYRFASFSGNVRMMVLVELGRWVDREAIRELARQLSERPIATSSAKAVRLLRDARLGSKRKKPNVARKFAELADQLNGQGVAWFDMSMALAKVSRAVMQLGITPAPETTQAPETTTDEALGSYGAVSRDTGPEEASEAVPEVPTRVAVEEEPRLRIAIEAPRPRVDELEADSDDAEPTRMRSVA